VVAGWISASAAGEVGRGRQLGQHGEVGNLIKAHQGGEAHQRGALGGGAHWC
jgi:hypothetical protein